MKMMDCVEVIVEKDSYAKEGVHKGMQGIIWEDEPKDGCWVVLFPQCGDKEDIADLYMKAVSYTHLDVYKRQILSMCRQTLMCTNFSKVKVQSLSMTLPILRA